MMQGNITPRETSPCVVALVGFRVKHGSPRREGSFPEDMKTYQTDLGTSMFAGWKGFLGSGCKRNSTSGSNQNQYSQEIARRLTKVEQQIPR